MSAIAAMEIQVMSVWQCIQDQIGDELASVPISAAAKRPHLGRLGNYQVRIPKQYRPPELRAPDFYTDYCSVYNFTNPMHASRFCNTLTLADIPFYYIQIR